MLFITGDTHGAYSRGCHQRINGYLNRFDMQSFPEQKDLTRNDYVISQATSAGYRNSAAIIQTQKQNGFGK